MTATQRLEAVDETTLRRIRAQAEQPTPPDVWTEDKIRALGVRTDGVTACQIIYGIARSKAYQRLRAGDVEFPVLRRGRKYIVPTSAILALLGLGSEAQA